MKYPRNSVEAVDLKLRVVSATRGGMPVRYAAREFGIAVGTVRRWRKRFQQGGVSELVARKAGGR